MLSIFARLSYLSRRLLLSLPLFSFSFSLLSTLLLVLVLSLSASLSLAIRLVVVGSLSLGLSRSTPPITYRLSFSLVCDSPGPEVVMSASVARPVASRRIVANDDVTLEISRPVIQVVSLCTA